MERLATVDWFTIIAALCFWQALVWAQPLDRGFPIWLRRSAWPCLALWLLAWNFTERPGLVLALAAGAVWLGLRIWKKRRDSH